MAYSYEYINKLDQFGISIFNLKLTDTDGVLPETIIPVSLKNNEISEERLKLIADSIIEEQTKTHTKLDVIIDNSIISDESISVPNEVSEETSDVIIDNSIISDENVSVPNEVSQETTEIIINTDIV